MKNRKWKKQFVGEGSVTDVPLDAVKASLRGWYRNLQETLRLLPSGQMLRTSMAYFWWEE